MFNLSYDVGVLSRDLLEGGYIDFEDLVLILDSFPEEEEDDLPPELV